MWALHQPPPTQPHRGLEVPCPHPKSYTGASQSQGLEFGGAESSCSDRWGPRLRVWGEERLLKAACPQITLESQMNVKWDRTYSWVIPAFPHRSSPPFKEKCIFSSWASLFPHPPGGLRVLPARVPESEIWDRETGYGDKGPETWEGREQGTHGRGMWAALGGTSLVQLRVR